MGGRVAERGQVAYCFSFKLDLFKTGVGIRERDGVLNGGNENAVDEGCGSY